MVGIPDPLHHQRIVDILGAGDKDVMGSPMGIGLCCLDNAWGLHPQGQAEGDQQVFPRPALHPPPWQGYGGECMAVTQGDLFFSPQL